MPTFDLTKLLNPKNLMYLVLLVVLGGAGWKGYNWIYDRGYNKHAAETKELVDQLTKSRDEAVDNFNTYKGTYDDWVKNTKEANEQRLADQKKDLDAREKRLADAEKAFRNKPVTIKEVVKYVPAQVDATYHLPVGFVRLYRDSIEGRSAGADSGSGVSGSITQDAGEASGITMSQFGQIAASNNAECVLRGKVIDEWQGWYAHNKASIDQLQSWQRKYAPKGPIIEKPPSSAIGPTK